MSTSRMQQTKEIYLSQTELSLKSHIKKLTGKITVDPNHFKSKRNAGNYNAIYSKDTTSNSNTTNTIVLKKKTGSMSHLMNGNESTLPLSVQFDSASKESDKRHLETPVNEKRQSNANVLPAREHSDKEAVNVSVVCQALQKLNDDIRVLSSNNQKMKGDLTKIIAYLTKEKKTFVELASRDKHLVQLGHKLENANLNLQLIKSLRNKIANTLPELESSPLNREVQSNQTSPYLEKKVKPTKPAKKTMKMEIHLPTASEFAIEQTQSQPRPSHPNYPYSAKSSARRIQPGHILSARSVERAATAKGSNSSQILLRKLSDQGNEYYTNPTSSSLRNLKMQPEEAMNLSSPKESKERLFKVSRVGAKSKENRLSQGGSVSTGMESSLQIDDLETTNRKTNKSQINTKKFPEDSMMVPFKALAKRIDNVLKRYESGEKTMRSENNTLMKVLEARLSAKK